MIKDTSMVSVLSTPSSLMAFIWKVYVLGGQAGKGDIIGLGSGPCAIYSKHSIIIRKRLLTSQRISIKKESQAIFPGAKFQILTWVSYFFRFTITFFKLISGGTVFL